jgi:hypothetical protein
LRIKPVMMAGSSGHFALAIIWGRQIDGFG